MYTNLLTAASLCAVVLASPQLHRRQDVDSAAIASSLSSISSALVPAPSIAAQLASIPASVQSLQNSPSGLAQLESEFLASFPAWYTSLSPEAQAYILSAGPAKATIFSLESLLTASPAATGSVTATPTPTLTGPVTGIVNGTIATLVPVGTGGLTIASSTGNGTVTTKKLSSTTATATETETDTKESKTTATSEKTTVPKSSSNPSPIESSSKAGAAQVTGVVGAGLIGLAGLVWAL